MKKGSSVVPALVKVIRQGTIPLLGAVLAAGAAYGAGLDREAPDLSRGWTRDLSGRGQLAARSTAGFEPGRLEVEPGAEVKITRGSEGVTARAERPDWVVALMSAGSLEGGSIAAGEVGTVPAARAGGGRVRVEAAVALIEPGTAVRVRLIDGAGAVVQALEVSSPSPVRWRADLGTLPGSRLSGDARLEVEVLRGRAAATLSLRRPGAPQGGAVRPALTKTLRGSGSFNTSINWSSSGNLYYYVTGGPANTCGDLNTFRNGSTVVSPGWLCTDASGNATKGPWTWSSTPGDQTDDPAKIVWPDGSETSGASHIWDKTCATTTITAQSSSVFSGSASDAQWGAGFNSSWTDAFCTYQDGNGRYWGPGLTSYSSNSPIAVSATVSGMPGFSVTWSCQTPPFSVQFNNINHWTACVTDGGCGTCDEVFFGIIP